MPRPRLIFASVIAATLPALPARAASRYWVNSTLSGGANWSNTANWSATSNGSSGAPVPTSADAVFLNYNDPLGLSVTPPLLNVNASVASLSIGSVATGTPLINQSANVTFSSTGDEIIGYQSNGRGAYNQSAGINNALANLTLGSPSSSRGTYNLSATGTLNVTATLLLGDSGNGVFNQSGSLSAVHAPTLQLGNANSSTGAYNLNDGSLSISTSEIIGDNTSLSAALPSGTFTQSAGLNTTPSLTIGFNGGTTGTYTLAGGTLATSSTTIARANSPAIGSANGTFAQSAGSFTTDTLTIADLATPNGVVIGTFSLTGGSVTVNQEVLIGSNSFSSLTTTHGPTGYIIQSGGSLTTPLLYIAYGNFSGTARANGSYTLSAGSLTVTNSELLGSPINAATFTQTGGTHSTPTLSITSPSTYNHSAGTLAISSTFDLSGSYSLSGSASLSATSVSLNSPFASFAQTGAASLSYATFAQSQGIATFDALPVGTPGTIASSGSTSSYLLTGGLLTAKNVNIYPNALFSAQSFGSYTPATITQTGGVASFAGTNTTLTLDAPAPSPASYTLSDGFLLANREVVGLTSTGVITQSGGLNAADAGGATNLLLGETPTATGTYNLTGGSLSTSFAQIAYAGIGNFVQTGGTHSNLTQLSIGDNSTATGPGVGTYTLAGPTASLDARYLEVGHSSRGTFTQSNGFVIASIQLDIGSGSFATGAYALSGGSLVATTEYVGSFGNGSFAQTGGSHLVLKDLSIAPGSTSAGSYSLTSGSLTILGNLNLASYQLRPATFTQTGGTTTLNGALTIYSSATFTLTAPARFTLATSPLIWNYTTTSPIDTLRHYLHDNLLTSTAVTADPTHLTALAYYDTGSSSVTTQLTLLGDLNLDGKVNADDYALLDRSYAQHLPNPHWTDGDFNYDGTINNQDYLLIDRTYLTQSQSPNPAFLAARESQFGATYVTTLLASVPEPTSALACLVATLPLLRRRRHK